MQLRIYKDNILGEYMAGIIYTTNKSGDRVGRWSGKSYRDENGKPQKTGQLYLGKVIDEERLIFFKKEVGYYVFNPDDKSGRPVTTGDVPVVRTSPDRREHTPNPIILFGGPDFLKRVVTGIGYDSVLNTLTVANRDSLSAMLDFTLLSNESDMHASRWLRDSVSKYYYPHADLESQRISELLASLASPTNRHGFFKAHIDFVKGTTEDECCIILDSTGCPNACRLPITKVSNHEGDINVEFRIVTVVHRATGLPLYFEIVPGNVIDSSTIETIITKMEGYGLKVTLVSGDAGYSCPRGMEYLILSGSDILMRLNPAYSLYKNLLEKHLPDLSPNSKENVIRFLNRDLIVIKIATTLGKSIVDGTPIEGYVYLCRDLNAYNNKSYHARANRKILESHTTEELQDLCEKYGIFAIVDTRDIAAEDIVAEYYVRLNVENFFKTSKDLAKLTPIRKQNEDTVYGHVLLGFIGGFISTLIRNKMNILDLQYVAVPRPLVKEASTEDTVEIPEQGGAQKQEVIMAQTPYEMVFRSDPGALFHDLNRIQADVFENSDDGTTTLVPSVLHKEAREYYSSFGLNCPYKVVITKDSVPIPHLHLGKKDTISKHRVFALRPYATNEAILAAREEKEKKKTEAETSGQEQKPSDAAAPGVLEQGDKIPEPPKEKRRPGRPLGSKNKKTLEREREQDRLFAAGEAPEKRKRGRPPGSKNKKTIEKEAEAARQEEMTKRRRGRPPGSRNKKTLEREEKERRRQKRLERAQKRAEENKSDD